MFEFLHTFTPQPVLFQFGFITVYWYGLFVVSGIIAGLAVVLRLAKRVGISSDEVYNLGFYAIIAGLVGARIYSVFLDLPFYLQHPAQIVAVWNGGLAIHGAIIGGGSAFLMYAWRKRQNIWRWLDVTVPGLALGQAIGRFGNYFNQELSGTPTDLPWGIPIERLNRPLEYLTATHFHPTFLYESILNLLNFIILLFIFKKWSGEGENSFEKRFQVPSSKFQGLIFLIYLINYSVIRILMEQLRTDPAPEIFGLRLPVAVSAAVIVVCVSFIGYRWQRRTNIVNFK